MARTGRVVGQDGLNSADKTKLENSENIKYGITIDDTTGTFTGDATGTAGNLEYGEVMYALGEAVTGTVQVLEDGQEISSYSTDAKGVHLVMSNGKSIIGAGNSVSIPISEVPAASIAYGYTVLGVSGSYDSAGTLSAGVILKGYVGYSKGNKYTGTMSNNSGATLVATSSSYSGTALLLTIPSAGYVSTSSKISFTDSNWVAANIAVNKTIFGKAGTYTSDATGAATDIRAGKTAYINGTKVTGTVTAVAANGAVSASLAASSEGSISLSAASRYLVEAGGKFTLSDSSFTASSIISGKTVLGLAGTNSGGSTVTGSYSATNTIKTVGNTVTIPSGAKVVVFYATTKDSNNAYCTAVDIYFAESLTGLRGDTSNYRSSTGITTVTETEVTLKAIAGYAIDDNLYMYDYTTSRGDDYTVYSQSDNGTTETFMVYFPRGSEYVPYDGYIHYIAYY